MSLIVYNKNWYVLICWWHVDLNAFWETAPFSLVSVSYPDKIQMSFKSRCSLTVSNMWVSEEQNLENWMNLRGLNTLFEIGSSQIYNYKKVCQMYHYLDVYDCKYTQLHAFQFYQDVQKHPQQKNVWDIRRPQWGSSRGKFESPLTVLSWVA